MGGIVGETKLNKKLIVDRVVKREGVGGFNGSIDIILKNGDFIRLTNREKGLFILQLMLLEQERYNNSLLGGKMFPYAYIIPALQKAYPELIIEDNEKFFTMKFYKNELELANKESKKHGHSNIDNLIKNFVDKIEKLRNK